MQIDRVIPSLFSLALLLACGACALSPQSIKILPLVEVQRSTAGNNTWLAIEVKDNRQSNVIGYRGGIYETATITTEEDIAASLRNEITRVYRELGYQIADPGAATDARLTLGVQDIAYAARQNNLLWNIEVAVTIRADVETGGRITSNTIEDRLSKDFPNPPTPAQNGNLVNDVINRVLRRIVEDETLRGALRRNQ